MPRLERSVGATSGRKKAPDVSKVGANRPSRTKLATGQSKHLEGKSGCNQGNASVQDSGESAAASNSSSNSA